MAAKIIVFGFMGIICFFIVRDYNKRKKSFPIEKPLSIGANLPGFFFQVLLEGFFGGL